MDNYLIPVFLVLAVMSVAAFVCVIALVGYVMLIARLCQHSFRIAHLLLVTAAISVILAIFRGGEAAGVTALIFFGCTCYVVIRHLNAKERMALWAEECDRLISN